MPRRTNARSADAMQSVQEFQNCAELLKAIADPARLRIVLCLFEGIKNVGQIAELLGDDMVKVSHHLSVLRHAGIVVTQRQGRYINYQLHPDVVLHSSDDGQGRSIEFGCCRLDLTTCR